MIKRIDKALDNFLGKFFRDKSTVKIAKALVLLMIVLVAGIFLLQTVISIEILIVVAGAILAIAIVFFLEKSNRKRDDT